MKGWRVTFYLTLKERVQFEFDTEDECEKTKLLCLKKGINGNDKYGCSYFYPARRINKVTINKI